MKHSDTHSPLEPADLVKDVDDKKMSDEEAVVWKVCVLCEQYMRGDELKQ